MFGLKKKSNDTFKNNVSNNSTDQSGTTNRIGRGTEIQGEIISDGTIRIEGTLEGYLESKSRIIIGASGVVKGDIKCKSMDIAGKVIGTIKVEEILTLKDKSHVEGDIHSRKLIIDPGASFNGNCKMGTGTPAISAGKKTSTNTTTPQGLSNKKVG